MSEAALSRPLRVFVSYSKDNHAEMELLEKSLAAYEGRYYTCFIDKNDLRPGDQVDGVISDALRECDVALFLVSVSWFSSHYCFMIEFDHALEREEEGSVRIVTVLLDSVKYQKTEIDNRDMLAKNELGRPVPLEDLPSAGKAFSQVAEYLQMEAEKRGVTPRSRVGRNARRSETTDWIDVRPDTKYFGRASQIAQLEAMLDVRPRQPVALTGAGGWGKTGVALQYARRHADSYAVIAKLVATEEEFASSCSRIAQKLELAASDQALHSLRRWMSTTSRWLLILDNVVPETLERVRELIPGDAQGDVILTSQAPLVGFREIHIGGLDQSAAVEMIVEAGGSGTDPAEARELAAELSFQPLSLTGACGELQSGTSLTDYLARLRTRRRRDE